MYFYFPRVVNIQFCTSPFCYGTYYEMGQNDPSQFTDWKMRPKKKKKTPENPPHYLLKALEVFTGGIMAQTQIS